MNIDLISRKSHRIHRLCIKIAAIEQRTRQHGFSVTLLVTSVSPDNVSHRIALPKTPDPPLSRDGEAQKGDVAKGKG